MAANSLCIYSLQINPSSKSTVSKSFTRRNSNCSVRLKTVLKSSPHNDTTTTTKTTPSLNTSPPKSKPSSVSPGRVDPGSSPGNSLPDSFSLLVRRLREGFKVDELAVEILSIALPAALALAADPIALLVDTAFVGHIGSVELAAVGVSISVFNLVSKLFNVPLLNITTSFVAEELALISKGNDDDGAEQRGKKVLPSVSASLALAAGIGIAETIALSFGPGFLMNIMGFSNADAS